MKKILFFIIITLSAITAKSQIKISDLPTSVGNSDSVWASVVDGGITKKIRGYKFKGTIPAQFNPIAGTNISISGTYPNITFNATGGGNDSAYLSGFVVNDSTLRLYRDNGDSSDFVIVGTGGTAIDTTAAFVNNVTSINDSTIRVFIGATQTDLVITGGVGGAAISDHLIQTENFINYSIPFAPSSFTDSTLVSQLDGATTSYYFNKGLWLNGNYTGTIENSRLVAWNYGLIVNNKYTQKMIFKVGDSSSSLKIGIGVKSNQTSGNNINATAYLDVIIGDSANSYLHNTGYLNDQVKSGVLINNGDYIELQFNHFEDSLVVYYRNLSNNNSGTVVRKVDWSSSTSYGSLYGYPTIYFAKGNAQLINFNIEHEDYDVLVLGASVTAGARVDSIQYGYVNQLKKFTNAKIMNGARNAGYTRDYFNVKKELEIKNKTVILGATFSLGLYLGISDSVVKQEYIDFINQLRKGNNKIIHIDAAYRVSFLGPLGWAGIDAQNLWLDTTFAGIDSIVHLREALTYPGDYLDGAHPNRVGNTKMADKILKDIPYLFELLPVRKTTEILDSNYYKPLYQLDSTGEKVAGNWDQNLGQWRTSGTNIINKNTGSVLIGATTSAGVLTVESPSSSVPLSLKSTSSAGGVYMKVDNLGLGSGSASGVRFYNNGVLGTQIYQLASTNITGASDLLIQNIVRNIQLVSNFGRIQMNIGTAGGETSSKYNFTTTGIGIGANITPDASASIDINKTNQGILINRLTTAERDAIASPAVGLMIYNTTDSAFNFYRSSGWAAIGSAGSMVYPAAGIALSNGSGWDASITDNSSNWNTAYSQTRQWDGGATGLTAGTGRTSLGGTTIGQNIFTSTNPSAIRFPRANADNTFDWLSDTDFRTAIGAQPIDTTAAFVNNVTKINDSTIRVFKGAAQTDLLIRGNSTGGSGATPALDNLASVAINTSLLPATDNAIDLGSAAKQWRDVYITGELGKTGTRVARGWFADIESNNMPTVGGTSLSAIFQPLNSNLTTYAGITPSANVQTMLGSADNATIRSNIGAGVGNGTVTDIGVTTANGVSGSSSGGPTPNLTITLGEITPTSVNGNTFTTGSSTYTGSASATYTMPPTTSYMQPGIGSKRMKWHIGNGNGTGVSTVGWTITAVGTATTANVATTNRHTQSAGVEYLVTTPSTSAIAGFRETATQQFFGNSAGNGGFYFVCRFGPATGVATSTTRLFVGMGASASAPTDVEPSSLLNQCGVGWDAADANIQFMMNGGSGSATKTDLGIAVPTVDRTSLYELRMWVLPNSSVVNYIFSDLAEGGTVVSSSTSTDVPTTNTLLAAKGWMSVGGTSSVIGLACKYLYVESNY
jgi:hypothetical protein